MFVCCLQKERGWKRKRFKLSRRKDLLRFFPHKRLWTQGSPEDTVRRLRGSLSLNRHWRSTTAPTYGLRPVLEYASIAWPAGVTGSLARLSRTFPATGIQSYSAPTCLWALRSRPWPCCWRSTRHLNNRVASSGRLLLGSSDLANKTAPQHLLDENFPTQPSTYSLRRSSIFQLPKPNTSYFQSFPIYFAAHIFNSLPAHLQTITKESEFKKKAKQHLHSPICPFLTFCRTWTKRYLITLQTRVKRVSRIHHRTILKRVLPTMHLHPRCLDRPLGPSFRSETEKDVQR